MIKTGKSSYPDVELGPQAAIIHAVEVKPNQFYDPEKEGSCESILNFTFQTPNGALVWKSFVEPDPENGIFGALCEILGDAPKMGEDFDEQSFVGLDCMIDVFIKKLKDGRKFTDVKKVWEPTAADRGAAPNATEEEKEAAAEAAPGATPPEVEAPADPPVATPPPKKKA